MSFVVVVLLPVTTDWCCTSGNYNYRQPQHCCPA